MTTVKIKNIKQGDLFSFIADDGKYKALLCTGIYIDKSPNNFTFCALTYSSYEKPTIEITKESSFFGVGDATKNNIYKHSDEELEKMWIIHPEIKPYILGCYNFIIWRKDFMKFRDNFEFIGNLNVVNNIDKNGNGSVNASNWEGLKNLFNEKLYEIMSQRDQKIFKLKSIIKE
ncbi:hypothetical protein [Flavobacterium piscisymbiosum]|uniref:Lysozyme n=1 Tax=Flavobacterium piscisymbiosum TaxID=2893753 RepID=A0ABS8MJH7_9FLAO|nr:hypothetical protein [Flavobacterium sp. F-30]MCC9065637.1 hypothetical protein [Flavobacterium sp. F-30]